MRSFALWKSGGPAQLLLIVIFVVALLPGCVGPRVGVTGATVPATADVAVEVDHHGAGHCITDAVGVAGTLRSQAAAERDVPDLGEGSTDLRRCPGFTPATSTVLISSSALLPHGRRLLLLLSVMRS